MNHYECLSIISGKYAETEIGPIIATLEESIKKHASAVHFVQNLERRKLAYPIDHNSYGNYLLVEFDAEPAVLPKIDRALQLSNEVIRHILVKRDTIGKPKDLDRVRERETERPSAAHKQAVSELDSLVPLNLDEVSEVIKIESAPEVPPIPETLVKKEQPIKDSEEEQEKSREAGSGSSKKQSKVSYEDLDKKLDEILGKDII